MAAKGRSLEPEASGKRIHGAGHLLIGTPLPSLATGPNRGPVSIPGAFSFPRSELNLILPNDSQEVGMFCLPSRFPRKTEHERERIKQEMAKRSRPIAGRLSSARQGELRAAAGRARRISTCLRGRASERAAVQKLDELSSHPCGEHFFHPMLGCPSCGNPMRLVRAIPASRLPELRSYDCRQCGMAMTEADDSQLASATASDYAPVIDALLNHGLMVSVPDPPPDPKMDQRDTALRRRRL